jgi:hemerythrin-like domain-containing protein
LGREFTPALRQTVGEALHFIRNYADRFHHAKEEDILFKYFDEGSDILTIMCKEHEIGRGHVRAAAAALEQGKATAIIEHLAAYGALLMEHIRKEDEILYPWMNSLLSDSQVGQLFTKFGVVDKQFEAGIKDDLGLVERMEKGYSPEREGNI